MEIIADLHIHSRYSMATSKLGTPEYLDLWARKKGISLVGTGDFTHPAWREELKEKLVPAESGLYRLRDEYVMEEAKEADKIAGRLEKIGNIHSDGRPILGLDCHDLLEILLENCADGMLVPAHIWTPHFGLFGAASGFDTMEECFEDLMFMLWRRDYLQIHL